MRTQLPLAVLKLKLIQTPNNFNRLLSIRSQMWFSCLISVRCHSSPNVKHSVKLHWLGSSSLLSTVGLLACSSNPHSEIGSVAYIYLVCPWVICIFDITRTNWSHVWLSGSDHALSFPGRLCAYNSLAFLICMCFTINYTMMKLPKFSPLMKKKSYSSTRST